jgi:multiple sugar transport system permease protein
VENTSNYAGIKDTEKKRRAVANALIYAGLGLWAVLVIFPFYWMILTSFKSYASYNAEYVPRFIALPPTFANFTNVFTEISLGRYLVNTLVYTIATTALLLVIAVLSAFAFARLKFKGRDLLFTLFLSLMMIPNELVIITNFVTVTNLGMRNSFLGLILPSAASVFYIYLLKENFAAIPDELYWAAKVDGTKDMRYLLKVMVPMCRPTVITIIILKVIECWNSYVWPRLITDDPAYFLVSNGIQELRENGMGRENIPAMMAAVVVISLPLIVLFLIFRRKIMAGVARGGTKG